MMPTMTTKTSKDSETRFTVVRQATFALAFTIAAGCGYDSSYSMAPPAPDPAVEDGLWTVSASAPAVLHLAPTQLLTDGDRTPVASISTPSATLSELNGMAFDLSTPHGRMMAIMLAGIAEDAMSAVMRSRGARTQELPGFLGVRCYA